MSLSNKRKKRTKAEKKERGNAMEVSRRTHLVQALHGGDGGRLWRSLDPCHPTGPHCAVRSNVDAEEICHLAETMLMQNIDPTHRPAIEAVAVLQGHPYTAPSYRPQLIEAAILAAADPVFIAESGPDAPWRKEELAVLFG